MFKLDLEKPVRPSRAAMTRGEVSNPDPAFQIHLPPFLLLLLLFVVAILAQQFQVVPAETDCRIPDVLIRQRNPVMHFQRPVR